MLCEIYLKIVSNYPKNWVRLFVLCIIAALRTPVPLYVKLKTLTTVRRVANITDFSVEVQNLKNDPCFSRFLYGVSKFSDFLRILQFFYFFQLFLS